MKEYIACEPKYCQDCGELFLRKVGTKEAYCAKHKGVTLPTIVHGPMRRSGFRMKQYAWSELPKFLNESKAIH